MIISKRVLDRLSHKQYEFVQIKENDFLCKRLNKNELFCINIYNGKEEKITIEKVLDYDKPSTEIDLSFMKYIITFTANLLDNRYHYVNKINEQIIRNACIQFLKSFK